MCIEEILLLLERGVVPGLAYILFEVWLVYVSIYRGGSRVDVRRGGEHEAKI